MLSSLSKATTPGTTAAVAVVVVAVASTLIITLPLLRHSYKYTYVDLVGWLAGKYDTLLRAAAVVSNYYYVHII